ncbi:MAG TPA: NAD-dependent deacylase [Anaerolineales bacterium]|jgi:NAD-dependent deacetylase
MIPFSSQILESIEFAAELLREARHAIVLTGAGLSTPSGIPDFRSEGKGLWSHDEPLEAASLLTFRTRPEQFFKWFRPLARQIFEAQPNPAHLALAKLEASGWLHGVLTQNIDMLHHKAGSQKVYELHGTLRTLSCTQCYRKYGYEIYLPAFIENGTIPHCPVCSAILKPDVILFGEQLPQKVLSAAQREARECDLIIVIGSSLEVLPVAGFPMLAIDRGAHLIIINNSPTYLNVRADIVLPEDVARIIPAIAERVLDADQR